MLTRAHFRRCVPAFCQCEAKWYKLLFGLATAAASLEFWFGTYAHSGGVQADALHASIHSMLDGGVVFIAWLVKFFLINPKSEAKIRVLFSLYFYVLFFASVAFVLYKAVFRLFYATSEIDGLLMTLGVTVGLVGNAVALIILRRINWILLGKYDREHEQYNVCEKLSLDARTDLYFSLVVFAAAIIQWGTSYVDFFNSYSALIKRLDPMLTIFIAVVAMLSGVKLLRIDTNVRCTLLAVRTKIFN